MRGDERASAVQTPTSNDGQALDVSSQRLAVHLPVSGHVPIATGHQRHSEEEQGHAARGP